MRNQRLSLLLPIGASGLIAALPVFFIACDYASVQKTRLLTTIFIAIWIVLGGIGSIGRGWTLHKRPPMFLSLLGFLGLYYFNWATWSKGTELDELMWAYSIAGAVVPLVFGSLFERKDLRPFFGMLTYWGAVLGALVLVGYILADEPTYSIGRFSVVEALNPITQSLVIGFAVLILYARVVLKGNFYVFVFIALLSFAMLLGGSRGPAISLVIAIVVMTVSAHRRSPKTALTFLLVSLSFGAAIIYLPELLLERYFSPEQWFARVEKGGIAARSLRMEVALERWWEHPFLGSGTSGNEGVRYSHNLFIQLLMETGIVGLILFLAVLLPLLINFLRTLRNYSRDEGAIAFIGFLSYGIIEAQFSGTFMGLNFLWISIGILSVSSRIFPHKKKHLILPKRNYYAFRSRKYDSSFIDPGAHRRS